MVPAVLPINIFMVLTAPTPCSLIRASGVAPEYPSTVKFVMSAANAISKKHLAPSAGFIKFCPSPPNIILTITIANTLPITASHHGRDAGRFNASNSPVTTALKSLTVFFLCTIRLKIHSDAIQLATDTKINTAALYPKLTIPNILVGSRAIIT